VASFLLAFPPKPCTLSYRAEYKKLKAFFNSIITATVIILSHKVQNPLTENDNHTMAKVITTHIQQYYYKRPNIICQQMMTNEAISIA
jgi:hypothetical protein